MIFTTSFNHKQYNHLQAFILGYTIHTSSSLMLILQPKKRTSLSWPLFSPNP